MLDIRHLKVAYGLTFRQLAILTVAGACFYGAWQALHDLVPGPLLTGAAVVLGGLVFALAAGRRDGLPMDVWLLAAVRGAGTARFGGPCAPVDLGPGAHPRAPRGLGVAWGSAGPRRAAPAECGRKVRAVL